MIAAILLAVVCLNPPLFDMSGPTCAAPFEACKCSECITWDVLPGALRYEVLRHNPGGSTTAVGTTKILGGYTDDGVTVPADPQELWCFAMDYPFPVEGATYAYEVRGCNSFGCGPWSGLTGSTTYVAAPYWCWAGGARVGC